ncbi:hypothetical protein DFJ73DRAFT_840909 [Zopfochytrium polystomum]|nr:hypothetical protein DFJ73DRAFT_840909 [Zopfochytrium polystomum]
MFSFFQEAAKPDTALAGLFKASAARVLSSARPASPIVHARSSHPQIGADVPALAGVDESNRAQAKKNESGRPKAREEPFPSIPKKRGAITEESRGSGHNESEERARKKRRSIGSTERAPTKVNFIPVGTPLSVVKEKSERTAFVGNVVVKVTEKSVLKGFKKLFVQFGSVESIRFRSIVSFKS